MKQQNLETVDLVLPSGTLWMKRNIGAEMPWDNGLLFEWGSPKAIGKNVIKDKNLIQDIETQISDRLQLLPKYDAAFMSTHGLMRMPTKEQVQELIDNSIIEYVTYYNSNIGRGKACLKVTSRINGKYIIFPQTAYSYIDSTKLHYTDSALIWTNTIDTEQQMYYGCLKTNNSFCMCYPPHYSKLCLPIRGVRSKN